MTKRETNLFRVAWLFYLLLAGAAILWLGVRPPGLSLRLLFAARGWWLDLALGLVAGGLLVLLWQLAGRWLSTARELEEKLATLLGGLTRADALGLAVLSGFAEELFFRGAVQMTLGLIPATLIFGLLHTGSGKAFRLWTLFALIAGLVLGGLMAWRGNLLAPIVAHILVNAVNLRRLARRNSFENSAAAATPDALEEESARGAVDSRDECS